MGQAKTPGVAACPECIATHNLYSEGILSKAFEGKGAVTLAFASRM